MEIRATPTSLEALAEAAQKNAWEKADEQADFFQVSKVLEEAAEFLKTVTILEQANVEHSDAMMIASLLYTRGKK